MLAQQSTESSGSELPVVQVLYSVQFSAPFLDQFFDSIRFQFVVSRLQEGSYPSPGGGIGINGLMGRDLASSIISFRHSTEFLALSDGVAKVGKNRFTLAWLASAYTVSLRDSRWMDFGFTSCKFQR